MISIIVLEDDDDLCDSVCRYLSLVGMETQAAHSVHQFFEIFEHRPASVVVMDINLPDGNGFDVAEELRRRDPSVGIVMLTARSQVDDRVVGLRAGADSYLVKPVQLRELDAVIRSLARRLDGAGDEAGGGTVDGDPGDLRWRFDRLEWALIPPQGERVALTNAEFRLMEALLAEPGHPASRDQIAESLGRQTQERGDRSIDAILTRLRRKVQAQTGVPLPVKAARAVGYVFIAPVEVINTP